MINFCLRDNLHRDAAPMPFSSFIYREKYPAVYQTCTATPPERNKICTRTAKSTPYPPCTGTIFWLKYQDPARMPRRVTQPPFIAGPLAQISKSETVSHRALFNMFRLDKIVSALIPGPAPRSIDNLPSRRHQQATVIKLTILLFTGTLPSCDE